LATAAQEVEKMVEHVDVAIVGAGGAGLTAAIYTARARRSTVVFEGKVLGGQIATTDIVENYPGFPEGINGLDLALRFEQQASRFGARLVYDGVERLAVNQDGSFTLATSGGDEYIAQAVIVTAGADYNHLGVPGEERLTGHGVSYCGTCDGAFFKDMEVVVVGGGNAAMDEGLFLTRYASKVHVIHRRDQLRADAILQERAFANPAMDFTWNTVIEAINGTDEVESVFLRNVETGEVSTLPIKGVFIFIGQTPNTHLLKGLVGLDAGGHAIVDLQMATSIPGLYVAGDIRTQAARQLISATGDGATAAIAAEHYLSGRIGAPALD